MKRNCVIDFFKFLFSVILVLFHSYLLLDDYTNVLFRNGAIAVEFYFLVSGYLMVQSDSNMPSFSNGDTWHFMIKKIRPLLLPVWCSWFISFVGIHIFVRGGVMRDGINSIFQILFIRNAGFKGYYCIPQTWYISGMLLTMWICHPFLHKYKEKYITVAAPLVALFLLGYLSHEFASIRNPNKYLDIIYKCQLRAIAEINLGMFCFYLTQHLKKFSFTKLGILLISLIEIFSYGISILYMYIGGGFLRLIFLLFFY